MSAQGHSRPFEFRRESAIASIAADFAMTLRAMCGRLRVGKDFLHVCSIGRCSHVFGLFSAVHLTAGHNALRGSGPGQNRAFDNALALVGCPDRRIDRLCITCCSPSQLPHHAGCPARSHSRRERDRFLVALALRQHCPCHPRELICQRNCSDLGRPPGE